MVLPLAMLVLLTVHAVLTMWAPIARGMARLLVAWVVAMRLVGILGDPVRLHMTMLGVPVHAVPVLAIHATASIIIPIAASISCTSVVHLAQLQKCTILQDQGVERQQTRPREHLCRLAATLLVSSAGCELK